MLPTALPTDFQPPTDCPGIPRLPTFQSKPRGCSHTLPPNPPPVGSWKSGPGRPSTFQTGVAREFLVGSGWKEAQRRPALMGSSLPNVPYPTKGLTARGSCDARFCDNLPRRKFEGNPPLARLAASGQSRRTPVCPLSDGVMAPNSLASPSSTVGTRSKARRIPIPSQANPNAIRRNLTRNANDGCAGERTGTSGRSARSVGTWKNVAARKREEVIDRRWPRPPPWGVACQRCGLSGPCCIHAHTARLIATGQRIPAVISSAPRARTPPASGPLR